MSVKHEISEILNGLPHWLTIGAASLGFAMAEAPTPANAATSGGVAPVRTEPVNNKSRLVARTEVDMGRLAYRAFHDRRPSGFHMTIYPEGATAVWEFTQTNVPTRYGSDKGGEYIVDIVAPISPGSSQQQLHPDYNHIYKLEVAEGGVTAQGPDGELNNGTILLAERTRNNTRIADVTYPFNTMTPIKSEAAARPLRHELGETFNTETSWNSLGRHILTMAEHHAPTGPLKQLWLQPSNMLPEAF